MTDVDYREKMLNVFRLLSGKYLDKWQAGSSKVSFILFLESDALCINNFWDADNFRKISTYQIDNNGKIRNRIVISEREDPELYNGVLKDYDKIKQQVRDAKLAKLSSLVSREKHLDKINYSRPS